MKMFGKGKASAKSNPKGPELPELMALMTKMMERLEALERKTDLVVSQTSGRTSQRREYPKPTPQAFVPSQLPRQSIPSAHSNEVRPAQGQPHGRGQGRRERLLHKAVCADCQKDCEIPFKPTGERPVYCKECFSKRKAGNSSNENHGHSPSSHPPQMTTPSAPSERQVVVTKKGVGKVTISEIVHPSSRDTAPKKKNPPPEKKAKR